MRETDLCSVDQTVAETLDDGEQVMVLWGENEVSGSFLDGVHGGECLLRS